MLRSLSTRRMLPVVALVTVALALTGCGDNKKDAPKKNATRSSGCGYKAGSVSDAVKVSGDFGTAIKATFTKPLKATSLQRTIITEGKGAKPATGDPVYVGLSIYNGTSGKLIDQESPKFTVGDSTLQKDLHATFECANYGSRVATTFPAKDLFGATGNAQAGISATDSLVVVTDVIQKYEPPAAKDWVGAPAVTFQGRTSPKVTLPTGDPSPDLLLHVIKPGTGQKVKSSDTVTVNYKGITWGTGEVFDQSYGKGKKPAAFPVSQVVPGFGAALVGQKVGAKLIVSIPPIYGYGSLGTSALAGKTLVFVIEIQSTKATKATPTPAQ